MRISSGIMLGGVLALATSGLAFAQTSPEGPYVGLEGGGNFLGDISPHGGGADTRSTWDSVRIAVTLTLTPSLARSAMIGPQNSPRVVVTGSLT